MYTAPPPGEPSARTRLRLRWLATCTIVLAIVLITAAIGLSGLDDATPSRASDRPGPSRSGDAELAAEAELATRPMPALPVEASAPQALAQDSPAGGLHLPKPSGELAGIAAGFPNTPEGAAAAVAALTTAGLRGGDPQTYIRAYRTMSATGAPAADQARLTKLLTSLRSSAGLAPTGPVAGLTMKWEPQQAQIKGVLDDGRYVVACVLGQFTADYQGRLVTYGVGDCQAVRWIATDPTTGANGQWLISPGPAAAIAPDAWPGSQDSIVTGYRTIR